LHEFDLFFRASGRDDLHSSLLRELDGHPVAHNSAYI
jgi:hypothetical protein